MCNMDLFTLCYIFTIFGYVQSNWILCGNPRVCYCFTEQVTEQVTCMGPKVIIFPQFSISIHKSTRILTIRNTHMYHIHNLSLFTWTGLRELHIMDNNYLADCENVKMRLLNEGKNVKINMPCDLSLTTTPHILNVTTTNNTTAGSSVISHPVWLAWAVPVSFVVCTLIIVISVLLCKKKLGKRKNGCLVNQIYTPTTIEDF